MLYLCFPRQVTGIVFHLENKTGMKIKAI